jgi:hypothetical protein
VPRARVVGERDPNGSDGTLVGEDLGQVEGRITVEPDGLPRRVEGGVRDDLQWLVGRADLDRAVRVGDQEGIGAAVVKDGELIGG